MILRLASASAEWYSNQATAGGLHQLLVESYNVRSSHDPEFNGPISQTRTMVVLVHLSSFADQPAVKSAIQLLETVLNDQLTIADLYHDVNDTSAPTVLSAHTLGSTVSGLTRLGSPRVEGWDWLPALGVEYAERRTVRIVLAADYQGDSVTTGTVVRLDDSVDYQGFGGRRTQWTAPIFGTPVRVQTHAITPRFAVQSGSAIVWGQYNYALPVTDVGLIESPLSSRRAGRVAKVNGQPALYHSSWRYLFSGTEDDPFVAVWPQV